MTTAVATLDDEALARLGQVMVGLLPLDELPAARLYLDDEGTPIARREGDLVEWIGPARWSAPPERSALPVTVAVAGRLPAATEVAASRLVLIPTGGIRPDDARSTRWVRAWQAVGTAVVEVPLSPAEAVKRSGELAARYSSGDLVAIDTVPQPNGAGRVVFFTGLSGSGKSTVARALVQRLAGARTITLLDGDVVRTHLSKGLGFSRADRDTNIRRIGWVAAEVAKHGGLAVCAPIAPYDESRRWVRATVEAAAGEGSFLLVWVSTPLDVCEARDVKGLYAKARRGELTEFTGVDDPYEPPNDADVVLDTSQLSLDEAFTLVVNALDATVAS